MLDETKLILNNEYFILKKSTYSHFFKLIFLLFFFIIWYSVLFGKIKTMDNTDFILILSFIAPLFSFFEIIRSVKIILGRDIFYFNTKTKEIFQDKFKLGYFTDVDYIQIRTISGSDSPNEYRLSIIFKNEKKFRLDQLKDYEKICDIADNLADIFDTNIKRKGEIES